MKSASDLALFVMSTMNFAFAPTASAFSHGSARRRHNEFKTQETIVNLWKKVYFATAALCAVFLVVSLF